ncbi:MAG: hypothetical protein WCJ71_05435 [Candidatus Omnitrophota bacterium]
MKKYLAVLMAVCVFSAFPSVLSCQCVDADCGSVSKSLQAKAPQCHPSADPSQGKSSSGKECCGKCQIENAAVLSNDLSPMSDVRHGNTLAEIKSFAGFRSKFQPLSLFQGECPESPPCFFQQHVLNTTFSFRAPPQGLAL